MNDDHIKAVMAAHRVRKLELMTVNAQTSPEQLYAALESHGWFWDREWGMWSKQLTLPGFDAVVGNSNPYQQ